MGPREVTPGALLALLMRRRGWSAPRLAEIAGGVSPSSVRAYLADRTIPRPDHALALARALGPLDGRALLDAWGHTDLADGFEEEWGAAAGTEDKAQRMTAAYYRLSRLEYPGDPLSEMGLAVAQAVVAWLQHVEQAVAPGGQLPYPPPPLPPTTHDPD